MASREHLLTTSLLYAMSKLFYPMVCFNMYKSLHEFNAVSNYPAIDAILNRPLHHSVHSARLLQPPCPPLRLLPRRDAVSC